MKHLYRRNVIRHRRRRRTCMQRIARWDYGAPLPLQPRRPLRALAHHPVYGGRVPVITGAALRADRELYWAYMAWVTGNMDRWIDDDRVRFWTIVLSWDADQRP